MTTKLNRIFVITMILMCCKMIANEEKYEKYADQIISVFAKKFVNQEQDVVCVGSGGRMPHNVEEISVYFYVYKKGSIKEARELEIKATEMLLKDINNDKKIKPYLNEYPFNANRVKVFLSFRKKDNSLYTDGSVVYTFQAKGKIYYYAEEANTEKRILLAEEPYEEAVKIVKEGK